MDFIPLASPDIRDADIELVNQVLRSGMLIQGTYVNKLEGEFRQITNTGAAIAVSNGTATLHLALKVLGIGPGDEVIVPAFSYVATANVVELVGATPVFVDIDLATFNIDVAGIEEKITSRTRAIIPVHEFGLACDIASVCALAKKHNLFVIEDAACALGATQNDQPVGSFGDFGSFSLHPRKSITSGEGGIITTNSPAFEQKLRQLRNHGIEMEDGKMIFEEAGFNYRMTDIQAALAYSQILRLQTILKDKQRLAEIYLNEIKREGIVLPYVPEGMNHTWQTFHVLLGEDLDQAHTIQALRNENIGVNYGAQCIPAQKYYLKKYELDSAALFPNALRAYQKGIALPLYEKLTDKQISAIAQKVNKL